MDSKFQSKLRVLDTDDVKQKTMFSWFVLLFYMSYVPATHEK